MLQRFGFRSIERLLELFDEVGNVQPVDQSVVYVYRYRHRGAVVRISNFAEGYAGRRVFAGEVARMGDGCEVEPGKNGITDQIGLGVVLEVISLPHPFEFDGRLGNELADALTELIVSKTNGAVWASDSATAINLFIAPDDAIDNACPEVLNLVSGNERAMQQ